MSDKEIYTLSENTIRKLRDDHFRILRMLNDLLARGGNNGGDDDNNTVLYRNDGAEQVPQYGVMRVTGWDSQYRVHLVDKPDADEPQCLYLINGHFPTSAGASGFGYGPHGSAEVLYDPADGAPQPGEMWGPRDDWKLRKSGHGFVIFGGARTENGLSIVQAAQTCCGEFVRFKLTEDLTTGGTAEAVIRVYTTTGYQDGPEILVTDWYAITNHAPGSTRGMWQGTTGMEGWARRSEVNADPDGPPEYDIVWMEQYAFDAEATLTESLADGTATAVVTASWHQGIEPGSTITVHDDRGAFPDTEAGCKASVSRSEYADPNNPDEPYYKAVHCTRTIKKAKATLLVPMCGTSLATGQWYDWTALPVGDHVVTVEPTGIVNADTLHYGSYGDTIYCERINNGVPGLWRVYDVTKHPHTVTLDLGIVSAQTGSGLQDQFVRTKVTAALEICQPPVPEILFAFGDCPTTYGSAMTSSLTVLDDSEDKSDDAGEFDAAIISPVLGA